MKHTRQEVIERTVREFDRLDGLLTELAAADWARPLARPETKDPWTVKDAVAHVAYWRANTSRTLRRQARPSEERALNLSQLNHLVYLRWHDRTPAEVLAWHRQVQAEVLQALQDASDSVFDRERSQWWPADLDGHSEEHRVKDIERVLVRKRAG